MRLYFDFSSSTLHPLRSGFVQLSNQERRNAPLPGDFFEYIDPLSAIGDTCDYLAPSTGARVATTGLVALHAYTTKSRAEPAKQPKNRYTKTMMTLLSTQTQVQFVPITSNNPITNP